MVNELRSCYKLNKKGSTFKWKKDNLPFHVSVIRVVQWLENAEQGGGTLFTDDERLEILINYLEEGFGPTSEKFNVKSTTLCTMISSSRINYMEGLCLIS